MISETWATSRSAATRGSDVLADRGGGRNDACRSCRPAKRSGRRAARRGCWQASSLSASSTLETPDKLGSGVGGGLVHPCRQPGRVTSLPVPLAILAAAVSALAVWSERVALSWSARSRMAMILVSLFLDLRGRRLRVLSLSTSSATDLTLMPALRPRWLLGLQDLQPRRSCRRRNRPGSCLSSGFFFAFMMFGSEA